MLIEKLTPEEFMKEKPSQRLRRALDYHPDMKYNWWALFDRAAPPACCPAALLAEAHGFEYITSMDFVWQEFNDAAGPWRDDTRFGPNLSLFMRLAWPPPTTRYDSSAATQPIGFYHSPTTTATNHPRTHDALPTLHMA